MSVPSVAMLWGTLYRLNVDTYSVVSVWILYWRERDQYVLLIKKKSTLTASFRTMPAVERSSTSKSTAPSWPVAVSGWGHWKILRFVFRSSYIVCFRGVYVHISLPGVLNAFITSASHDLLHRLIYRCVNTERHNSHSVDSTSNTLFSRRTRRWSVQWDHSHVLTVRKTSHLSNSR